MVVNVTVADWLVARCDAQPIRSRVFIDEQQVLVDLEWDEMDAVSLHAIARDADGVAVATGRLLPDGHIGRMAVLRPQRGLGVGAAVLEALIQVAQRRGDAALVLHAQRQAEGFYRRRGFVVEGEPFMEAGIEHVIMRYRI